MPSKPKTKSKTKPAMSTKDAMVKISKMSSSMPVADQRSARLAKLQETFVGKLSGKWIEIEFRDKSHMLLQDAIAIREEEVVYLISEHHGCNHYDVEEVKQCVLGEQQIV